MTVQVYSEKDGDRTTSPLFLTVTDYAVYMDMLMFTRPDRIVLDFHLKQVPKKEQPTPVVCQCFTTMGISATSG